MAEILVRVLPRILATSETSPPGFVKLVNRRGQFDISIPVGYLRVARLEPDDRDPVITVARTGNLRAPTLLADLRRRSGSGRSRPNEPPTASLPRARGVDLPVDAHALESRRGSADSIAAGCGHRDAWCDGGLPVARDGPAPQAPRPLSRSDRWPFYEDRQPGECDRLRIVSRPM